MIVIPSTKDVKDRPMTFGKARSGRPPIVSLLHEGHYRYQRAQAESAALKCQEMVSLVGLFSFLGMRVGAVCRFDNRRDAERAGICLWGLTSESWDVEV